MAIYLGLFEDGFIDQWDLSNELKQEIAALNIIIAAYEYECYSGDAFVLYEKDGKLYEVNDSHCSCFGLQNWEPEETFKEALLKRLGSDSYGVWHTYEKELREVIENLKY